jgi:hypothetical protein
MMIPALTIEERAEIAKKSLEHAVKAMELCGLVVTVYQKPKVPLAMGNYETVVEVRPARGVT